MAQKQQRVAFETKLKEFLGNDNVYFQPPEDFQLSYPCIVYKRSNIRPKFGDNLPYKLENQYTVTVITTDPDDLTPDKVAELPRCIFDRNFTTDYLYHDVFNIIF